MDAQVLWDALDGIGTDEERMNEIITMRHPEQVEEIERAFENLKENKDKKSLWDAVCGDTSFKYELFLKAMLDRAGYLAFQCYEAMHGESWDATGISSLGTNEQRLIRILCAVNKDNDGIKSVLKAYKDPFDQGWREDIERMAHLPDMEDIVAAYPKLHERGWGVNEDGKTLKESIESETSFDFRQTLLWMIKDKDECGAEAINESLDNVFASKEMILGVIASRSGFGRAGIAKAYARLYGKDLREDLSERLGDGGGFNQVARDMFQPLSERGADYLHLAMKGTDGDGGDKIDDSKKDNMLESAFRSGMVGNWGTDEQRVSRHILFASKVELKVRAVFFVCPYVFVCSYVCSYVFVCS